MNMKDKVEQMRTVKRFHLEQAQAKYNQELEGVKKCAAGSDFDIITFMDGYVRRLKEAQLRVETLSEELKELDFLLN